MQRQALQETQNVFPAIRARIEQALEKLEGELVSSMCAVSRTVMLIVDRRTARKPVATQRRSRRQRKYMQQERRLLLNSLRPWRPGMMYE